jgi:peptide/nickel transport system permease protein
MSEAGSLASVPMGGTGLTVQTTPGDAKPPRARRGYRGAVAQVGARLAQMVVVTFAVVLITFLLVHLVPGDPARSILGQRATPEAIAALHKQLHLDGSLLQQFWTFLRNAISGDLGASLVAGSLPVTSVVFPALKVTLAVIGCTVVISVIVGLALGVASGVSRRGLVDSSLRAVMMILLATPPFLIGFLLLLFALDTGAAPAGGWGTGALDDLHYLGLPSLALSAYLAPVIGRAARQSVQETLGQDFVEAAISRGLPARTLIFRHVIPNSMLPVISLLGYNMGALIGGAVIIEAVFNLPGIGSALVYAVSNRDYPVVQGTALVTAVLVILTNGLSDLAYRLADPRTRAHS